MNWIKKIIGASVLTSLFFIAPPEAFAETCGGCGLYNTGGYNLYVLGQNLNSVATCAAPMAVSTPMVVPTYLSNPSAYLSSFATPTFYGSPSFAMGGGCGTFTQSCGSCYDTLGLGGYGTLPMQPSIDSQLLQLISYQNGVLNQLNNPLLGTYPSTPSYPNYSYNPYYPPMNPISPIAPYYPPTGPISPTPYSPIAPYMPPTTPVSPYDNSLPFPTTPSLPYGGCDNITVMCPQSGVNTFENTFPNGSGSGGSGGSNPDLVPLPSYQPSIGAGSLPPNYYQIPRGLKAHR